MCQVGEHQNQLAHGIWGWGIYGLNGWGVNDKLVGHLWLKWVGQLWEICSQ